MQAENTQSEKRMYFTTLKAEKVNQNDPLNKQRNITVEEKFMIGNEVHHTNSRTFTWDSQPFVSALRQGVEADVEIFLDGESVGFGAIDLPKEEKKEETVETPAETQPEPAVENTDVPVEDTQVNSESANTESNE